ncbi:unnamed protein product [Didymodactylos carnosus]|uniref:Uncharacterized protein n=1 Tax=Didymodactylos carnosus TaxID=1234261 RepID=A0A814JDT5_9BILA|nr:unnamed protein product [Didymodactylos carnosus]CAF1034538.1 unnamed protein product [Didymodactylos carnosus]CAF3621459.1 unnamed protein product [Didymodactylos carnosus]CAF3805213.1 unnamed protein product [Didymodactylos carnosus]
MYPNQRQHEPAIRYNANQASLGYVQQQQYPTISQQQQYPIHSQQQQYPIHSQQQQYPIHSQQQQYPIHTQQQQLGYYPPPPISTGQGQFVAPPPPPFIQQQGFWHSQSWTSRWPIFPSTILAVVQSILSVSILACEIASIGRYFTYYTGLWGLIFFDGTWISLSTHARRKTRVTATIAFVWNFLSFIMSCVLLDQASKANNRYSAAVPQLQIANGVFFLITTLVYMTLYIVFNIIVFLADRRMENNNKQQFTSLPTDVSSDTKFTPPQPPPLYSAAESEQF